MPDALDQAYQDRLEALTPLRRRVADAAWLRKDLEDQIAATSATAQDRVIELRRQLAGAIEAEQQLTITSQRQQAHTDAFRTRKEVLKATYATAQAEHVIEQAWVQLGDDGGTEDDQAGPPVTGTAARLDDILDGIERELGDPAEAEGLMELRPGAPGDRPSSWPPRRYGKRGQGRLPKRRPTPSAVPSRFFRSSSLTTWTRSGPVRRP